MQELGETSELSRSKESFFNNVFIKMEGYLAGEAVLVILSIAEGNTIIKGKFFYFNIIK